MTGVIYARYSSDNQREESIEGQLRECKAFAEKNGIQIVGTYIDRALSAKTDNRPDFQKMIKDSAKQRFDTVIVWKLDRFARNRYDSAHYKSILKKNNVRVLSATEAISQGAEGIILESVLEGMAEYYSAELAEADNTYTLTADTTITLKATGTAGATGYCSIKIGDETYYTEQIFVNGSAFTFTINSAADTTITLTPKWGTYSHDATLHNGDVITATDSQQNNTQAPDNNVTTEPSTEPTAPAAPTAPTTPSSTPTESTTTTPEPSATSPTEH